MRANRSEHSFPRRILNNLHEWESIRFSRKPHSIMLIGILLINVIMVLLSAWVISAVAMRGNENTSFFTAVYNTFTMILDAGCIEEVISDPTQAANKVITGELPNEKEALLRFAESGIDKA